MTKKAIFRDRVGSKIVDVKFGLEGNLDAFRTMGFSSHEAGFTWSDGDTSRILLLDYRLDDEFLLFLEGNPFLCPGQVDQQEILVFFDGKFVTKFEVSARFFRAVTIATTGMATHTLEFRYPTRRSPAEFGLPDTRVLGIAWSCIRIYKMESVLVAPRRRPHKTEAADTRTPVAIVGNCFSESIARGLLSDTGIAKKMQIDSIPLHLTPLTEDTSIRTVAGASVVLCQYLADIDRDAIYSLVSKDAQVTWYPDVVLRVAWPFDSTHWRQDEIAKQRDSLKIRHHDGALALLRKVEKDKKKRIKRYRELDLGIRFEIPRLLDTQIRFLHAIDAKNDVKIADFVIQNYQARPLFYDCTHPSEYLIEELCSACAAELGITWARSDLREVNGWQDWSLPVHPLVGKQLGLRWSGDAVRYKYGTLGEVTWEQWVDAYIDEFG